MKDPIKKATPAKKSLSNITHTNTASQRNTIKQIIHSYGSMSTLDARANGIMHPAMRVCELRKQGFNIVTNWIYQTDGAGVDHRIGVYSMDGGSHA